MNLQPPTEQAKEVFIVGASKGIGLGFVKHFLTDPKVFTVFASYRTEEGHQALCALQGSHQSLVLIKLDILDEGSIKDACLALADQSKQLDTIINCVGILHDGDMRPEKSLRDISPEILNQYFSINSVGSIVLTKHLKPLLKRYRSRVYATISAKVGSIEDNKLGGWYGYRASKAALNMFIKTASIELTRECPGLAMVALHPGTTDTSLSKPFQSRVPEGKLFSVEKTTALLVKVINSLTEQQTGQFFSWDGARIPW